MIKGSKVDLTKHPNYGMSGKKHSLISRTQMSESHKGLIPWVKGKRKEEFPQLSKGGNRKGYVTSEKTKRLLRKRTKELWKDPLYAKKCLRRRIPSYPEQIFMDLCKEFRYVGNGALVIDGKNPDFVDSTGTKLVEIWGEHWHQGQNPQDRIDFFRLRGYQCLIVKALELRYPEQVLTKVRKFVEAR